MVDSPIFLAFYARRTSPDVVELPAAKELGDKDHRRWIVRAANQAAKAADFRCWMDTGSETSYKRDRPVSDGHAQT